MSHDLFPLIHLSILSASLAILRQIPEATWKALKFSTKRWNPFHAFPSCFFLHWKTENCFIQIFMSYFCGIFSFYYSLPSVPQDTRYIRTWYTKIISIFRDFPPPIHQEVKSFCCEPHNQCWKFYFKHPLCKHVCNPHAASFEARPWEEQENCWTVA